MSQFSATSVEAVKGTGTVAVAASPSEPLLAIATAGGEVMFCSDEGEKRAGFSVTRSAGVGVLRWHPSEPCVAVGWADGLVSFVDTGSRSDAGSGFARFDGRGAHGAAVSELRWSLDGARLLSADEGGKVVVWRFDGGSRATVLQRLSCGEQGVSHAAWLAPVVGDSGRRSEFACATSNGQVWVGDDSGSMQDVCSLGAPILALAFSPTTSSTTTSTTSSTPSLGRLLALSSAPELVLWDQAGEGRGDGGGALAQALRARVDTRGAAAVDMLAGAAPDTLAWVAPGVCATVGIGGGGGVRLWDVREGDSGWIGLAAVSGNQVPRGDEAVAIATSRAAATVAVGTVQGRVVLLRRKPPPPDTTPPRPTAAEAWTCVKVLQCAAPVRAICSGIGGLFCAALAEGAATITLSALRRILDKDIALIQAGPREATIFLKAGQTFALQPPRDTPAGVRVKSLSIHTKTALLYGDGKAHLYEIPSSSSSSSASATAALQPVASVAVGPSAAGAVLAGPTSPPAPLVWYVSRSMVQAKNSGGATRFVLPFGGTAGIPNAMASSGRYLAITTDRNICRVYDCGRSDPRLLAQGPFLAPSTSSTSSASSTLVHHMSVSPDGGAVAILVSAVDEEGVEERDDRVHVFTVARAASRAYQPSSGSPRFTTWSDDVLGGGEEGGEGGSEGDGEGDVKARFLAVQVDADGSEESDDEGEEGVEEESGRGKGGGGRCMVETVFVGWDGRVFSHDRISLSHNAECLLGFRPPSLYEVTRGEGGRTKIGATSLRDFVGVDEEVATAVSASPLKGSSSSLSPAKSRASMARQLRKSLLLFAFELARGNADAAHAAVRWVKSRTVWRNMAATCVQSGRIDVAEACLRKMRHARAVRALRDAVADSRGDNRVPRAAVAIQLGMLREGAQLLQAAGRRDLLAKLYRAAGDWEKAKRVSAEVSDDGKREEEGKSGDGKMGGGEDGAPLPSQTSLHYTLWARSLELDGDIPRAARAYESAGPEVARGEIPRMLADKQRFADLRGFADVHSGDVKLQRWMGQFAEASGDAAAAAGYYKRAHDAASMARLRCHAGDLDGAARDALAANSRAAALYVARQMEAAGRIADALKLYDAAGLPHHVARAAAAAGLESQAVAAALRADRSAKVTTAQFLESRGQFALAAQLWHAAGTLGRALSLCFKHKLFPQLRAIAADLASNPSATVRPELVRKAADFLAENGAFAEAVRVLAAAGDHIGAVQLAASKKVTIDDALADELTPPRRPSEAYLANHADDPNAAATYEKQRVETLQKLARALRKQGAWHLATKAYTAAGDRVKAMRCLLKSGDTEKIIVFAGVSRDREIYVLAANFLQTLEWHSDPDLMRAIISFYTRAKAKESLANFYAACADVEVEQYRNYDKAHEALLEARKQMQDSGAENLDRKLAALDDRAQAIDTFLRARAAADTDPGEMTSLARSLLSARGADAVVRPGDVFAMLLSYEWGKRRDGDSAAQLVRAMRDRGIDPVKHVGAETITAIADAVGDPSIATGRKDIGGSHGGGEEDDDDEIEEDIPEEFDA